GRQDRCVVYTREHHVSGRQVRLVFLALLERARGGLEIGKAGKALHSFELEIAVGHGVTQYGDAQTPRAEPAPEPARGLRFAAARADRRDRDDRSLCAKHRPVGAEQHEVSAGRKGTRRAVHDFFVGEIAIREHHLRYPLAPADGLEVYLFLNRDAVGIERAGEGRRVAAACDARDLRSGEGDDTDIRITAIDDVEVVK